MLVPELDPTVGLSAIPVAVAVDVPDAAPILPAAGSIVNVGVATTALLPTRADAGTVAVIVSCAVMS